MSLSLDRYVDYQLFVGYVEAIGLISQARDIRYPRQVPNYVGGGRLSANHGH